MGMRLMLLGCTTTLLCGMLAAQEGALDPTFNPTDQGFALGDGPNYLLTGVTLKPDGKMILTGSFTRYDSAQVGRIAQVNSDGSFDASFNPGGSGASNQVVGSALQPDGKIIISGFFASYNGNATVAEFTRLNANGSLDAAFTNNAAGLNSLVRSITVQPDGKIIIGGGFTNFGATGRNGIARLNADGSIDNSFFLGTGFYQVNGAAIHTIALQPDGKFIVGGSFTQYNGTARSNVARLNADGSLDTSFDPGTGADLTIRSCVLQPDGRIIIGGDLTTYGGIARHGIARLNTTGSLDTSFDPGTGSNGYVNTITLQPNGKVLVGGSFAAFSGNALKNLVRLNSDGNLDMSFDTGAGPDLDVTTTSLQPDGKIIVGGIFRTYAGAVRPSLLRLDVNGDLDTAFLPSGNGASCEVASLCLQPDGRILIGGRVDSGTSNSLFGYNNAVLRGIGRLNPNGGLDQSLAADVDVNLDLHDMALQADGKVLVGKATALSPARLNANGSLDPSFDPGTGAQGGVVRQIVVQPDGKILIGGSFTSYNGTPRNCIARTNVDGSLDASFNPGSGFSHPQGTATVNSMNLQPDGKIVVGGYFINVNGTVRSCIVRLNTDGSVDTSFNPGSGFFAFNNAQYVFSTSLQPDGKVVVGGRFTSFNGTTRLNIARLNTNGSIDASFNPGAGLNSSAIIYSIAVQPDGRIIVGGNFSTTTAPTRRHIVRLNPDGSFDALFNAGSGTDFQVYSIAVQADGGVIIGGSFTRYNGIGRNRIARINGTARSKIRVMYEGPYAGGSMSDALRTLPSFPLTEPFTAMGYAETGYTPGATIAPSILTTTGNNAIVDWLIVEMRPAATPNVVAASRAVLLQRDGDVVDLDGVSTVGFGGLAHGNYSVVVKPRNHLPVMLSTSTPFAYGTSTATVDFTLPGTQVYDADARKNVGGVMLLQAGDATFNEELMYVGLGNDRDPILTRIGGSTPTATVNGYWPEDVNMDGAVKYVGANNDRDPILLNVGGSTPTAVRNAALP